MVNSLVEGFRFFRSNIGHHVRTPHFQYLRKRLVNAEHIKLVEPVLDSVWNGGGGMISHDVRHVLEDLQVLDGEGFALVSVILVRLFELREILKNVPFELCPVEARGSGGGTELYLFAADLDSFLNH